MADQNFTDAIMLLRADHDEVKDLFDQFEDTDDGDEKRRLAEKICNELKIHSLIEEEIFYPAFRGVLEDDMLDEAVVEHDGAKLLINDIMDGVQANDSVFEAKVKVLSEQIEHHIEEEEKPHEGMFAKCRDTDVDLKALLEPMLRRKAELSKQAESEGLPPAEMSEVQPEAAH
ncbi:hemerythrin domain-containing protein [Tsuneonella sp. YG55]|uniref:Hemerythrin domain-containing protein n=1 Tax=Tsuneonella litorea TaxID=2976475 RepID=A0A9X2VZ89_9SPHN|nr:hemerythrin domain-containing protein [Tsuneonella litorea]MCT2558140.1 hemerythrin domain-containing protein [Tsuneonella litorea]